MRRIIEELEPAQRRSFYVLLALTSLIGAAILFIVIVKFKEPFAPFIIALFGFGALAMVSTAWYSIIRRSSKHAWIIIRLIVGVHILLPIVYLFLMLSLSMLYDLRSDPLVLDYTAEEAKIESVSMIKLESFNSSTAKLSYRITRDIDKSRWPQILNELKGFEFRRPFGDPRTRMYKDYRMLMIIFSEPTADGTTRAFISEYGIFINKKGETDGSAVEHGSNSLDYHSYQAVAFDECEAFIDSLITG